MSGMAGIHGAIRRITRAYPFRTPSNLVNTCLGKLFFDRPEPRWLVAEAYDLHPSMALNVATPFQRKIFYFPRAYARHWYGLPFASYLRHALAPGGVFIDVGANVGYYTLAAAAHVGSAGRVLAFEPDPITFEALRRSIELNRMAAHVTCVNEALSSFRGGAEIYRTDGTSHSLVAATAVYRNFAGAAQVRVTSLDAWMETAASPPSRVDLIKIDVEGEEPRTVAGMLATLPKVGLPDLWIEVRGPQGSKRAPSTFAPVREQLGALGYESYRWRDGERTAVDVPDVEGREDVLFVSRSKKA